jgi:phosphatidylinositol-3-phosphatase
MNDRRCLALVVAALLSLGGPLLRAQVPHSNHVIIVMEENHSYEDVFNSTSMPWLTGMAKQYTFLQYSYANAHYSLPNYMWLTAGKAVTFNDQTTSKFDVDNIVRYLLVAGKTWKEYAESLPYSGYTGPTTGYYVEGHDPFSYFTDVVNSSQKYNIVPFTHFSQDLAAGHLPNFAFVTPNGLHDGHNASLSAADTWLKTYIAPVLNTPAFQSGGTGVLIITFDESHDTDCRPNSTCGPEPGNVGGGRIATVIIGPQVKLGYRSTTKYMEQNVLRTILDLLGISGGPGASATAQPMSDIFR